MLSPARILLTNDDGIEAPGLNLLHELAKAMAPEIWVVAPLHDESGTGQSLSLHHPLRASGRGERRWAVRGTPADCVALAIAHFMKGARPDLILSGINAGANTGDDVNLSGTLGAAFMGLMLGIPSIAISQDCASRHAVPWDTSRKLIPKLLRHLLKSGWREDVCLSINVPNRPPEAVKKCSWARQGVRTVAHAHIERRVDVREQEYFWLSLKDQEPIKNGDSDHAALERGEIAVTALSLNRGVMMADRILDVNLDLRDG